VPDPGNQALVEVLAGLGVRLDAAQGALSIDGRVNMQSGAVEVFACAPEGKTHESVVVLDCVPRALQAGLYALGLEPGQPVTFEPGAGVRPPSGPGVEIEVQWLEAPGQRRVARAEDWIWDERRSSVMPHAAWIFAGSVEQPSSAEPDRVAFAADAVKSLVVTYHDAAAILENPHSEASDDASYSANERAVPAVGTPVTVVFRRAPRDSR
jgi:hypothetical protein